MRRADIWKAGWRLFEAHPIAGSGFGGFSAAITKYHQKSGGAAILGQAHNDYLEILTSGGLIGAALSMWFVLGLYKLVATRIHSDSGFLRAARAGGMIGVFGVAIHSLVEFGLHVPGNSVVLLALLAISIVDVRRDVTKPARPAA